MKSPFSITPLRRGHHPLLTEHMSGDEFAPWKMTPTGDPGMYYAD